MCIAFLSSSLTCQVADTNKEPPNVMSSTAAVQCYNNCVWYDDGKIINLLPLQKTDGPRFVMQI